MNIKDDGMRGMYSGDTVNLPAYKAGHQKGGQFSIGETHPPNPKKLAIHPRVQHRVFWLNCFESPAKRDLT